MATTRSLQRKAAAAKFCEVPFSVRLEQAREVILTGDFTVWAKNRIRLTQEASGEWRTTLNLAPGEYQYRLIVDGEWRDDPGAAKRVPNAFGCENGVLRIS